MSSITIKQHDPDVYCVAHGKIVVGKIHYDGSHYHYTDRHGIQWGCWQSLESAKRWLIRHYN